MSTEKYAKNQAKFIKEAGIAIGSLVKINDWGNDYCEEQIVEEYGWDEGYCTEYVNDGEERVVTDINTSGIRVDRIWFPWCVIEVIKSGIDKTAIRRSYPAEYEKCGIKDCNVEFLEMIFKAYPHDFWPVMFAVKDIPYDEEEF